MTDRTTSDPMVDLLPKWMAPGPTIYRSLMEDALREVLVDGGERLMELVPPVVRGEFMRELHGRLGRVYVRGVTEGYSQAGRAFDDREKAVDA